MTPKTLPNPNGKIMFSLDNDIDIYYDGFTSDMYYYHPSTYTNIIKLENRDEVSPMFFMFCRKHKS